MKTSRWDGLLLAQSLAVVLLILSFARIAGDAQSNGFRGAVLSTVFGAGGIWGSKLIWNVAAFGAALLALYLLFGLACWLVARASAIAWPSQQVPLKHHVLIWFIVMTIALLAHNAASFPRSSLGSPYAQAMMVPVAGISLGALLGILALVAAAVTIAVAAKKAAHRWVRVARPAAIVAAVGAIGTLLAIALPSEPARVAPQSRPNVILIGLDSLRPDVVAKQSSPGVTPNVEAFLSGAVSFTDAITPLARTFPSVTSIITGRSPHRTGAVVNLLPRDLIQEGDTLGRTLKRAGYYTAYGIDEVRFSNIDASYGFDTAITPPIGASEFMISLFADTPVSNLVVNTALGKLIFPHVHANRGAALVYDPDRFLDRVDDEVAFAAPMLLHLHLTLPHWPYTWIDAPVPRTALGEHTDPTAKWPAYYLDSVRRADRQFGDLMALLERRGVLGNAIVVLYSDHGESFGYDAESIVPVETSAVVELGVRPGHGHGTSVLAPHQYHCVLAMRGYGASRFPQSTSPSIDVPVTMQDIAPTLLDLVAKSAKVEHRSPFDGRSLVKLLEGDAGAASTFAGRIRFTETEYDPANVLSPNGQVSGSAVAAAATIYRVDPATDRIEIMRSKLPTLLHSRQYAAVGEHYLVAALPSETGFQYVSVDPQGGSMKRLGAGPDSSDPVEVHQLWQALRTEFGTILALSPGAGGI